MSLKFIKKFAEVFHPALESTLRPYSKIAELSQNQGSLSVSFLPYLPLTCEFFQVDSPMQNYTLLSYRPNPPLTSFVPGSIYSQLFPSNYIDTIIALQVFNQASQPYSSLEHLIPSLAPSDFFSKFLKNKQKQDLIQLLKHRHSELVPKGSLIFDLILKPSPSSTPYSWDCLDLAVKLSSKNLPHELKHDLNLHTVFRSMDQVKEVLEALKDLYQVEIFQENLIKFDEYQEFLDTQNLDSYIKALEDFWTGPIKMMMMRVFKGDSLKASENVESVMKVFKEICNDAKPIMEQNLLLVKLRKI